MADIQSLLENSKSNMMNMLKNRKYYLAIFSISYFTGCICFSIICKQNFIKNKTK